MASAIKYIKDQSGQLTSVLVPVKVWDDLNANYKKLQQKLKIMNDIHQALHEVQQSRKTGKKLRTIKEFLSESIS